MVVFVKHSSLYIGRPVCAKKCRPMCNNKGRVVSFEFLFKPYQHRSIVVLLAVARSFLALEYHNLYAQSALRNGFTSSDHRKLEATGLQ